MTDRYQTLRSISDHHVFVVCRDGTFYELVPEKVRHQGPWQGVHRGEIEKLKPQYRLALARDGYAPVRCELAVFKSEVWASPNQPACCNVGNSTAWSISPNQRLP